MTPPFDPTQALAANLLELIVMPTEQCNFRCTYCYEDFELGRMEPGVVRGLRHLMTRRAPRLDHLEISWFGGEPLLAADIVEEVQAHALGLTALHPQLTVSASMTTNGFLLDRDQFTRLLDLEVRRFQISLDGPCEHHDRKRVRVGGQPTFDRIWENLQAAHELDGAFEIIIRIHVDQDNVDAIPSLLEQCRESFGDDGRFRVFVRPLSRLGGSHDATIPVLEGEEGTRAIGALRRRAQELGLATFERGPALSVCYAAKANSFVVRSDGTLGKCTVALSHARNRVGRLFEDGRVKIEAESMQGWMRGLWSEDAEELRCPMEGFADPVVLPSPALIQIGGAPGIAM